MTHLHTVMTFGSFDLLHEGHLFYLNEAKKLGDHLITIVAHDETIKQRKSQAPTYSQTDRIKAIDEQHIVDIIVAGTSKNMFQWLDTYKPNILAV